jgi:sulfate transport system permease protein
MSGGKADFDVPDAPQAAVAPPTLHEFAIRNPQSEIRNDPAWVRWTLTVLALLILTVLVIVPVVSVFYQAFSRGAGVYFDNLFGDPDTRHAILLTLTVAPCAVVLNLVFGVAAAWAIARFRFRGRTLLITLIDIPFSVSPVVAGLMFVLLFGLGGFFGPLLRAHGLQILFSTPGLILATTFVTLPFVARELIPVMEAIGPDEELAALSLGAGGWEIFRRVTLPNIRWGLLYGVILCNARAMGEFGAVYVVSGHIAGQTNTMPLHIEQLFQGFNSPGAFAVASVLTLLAAVTLLLKVIVEQKARHSVREATKERGGAV